MNLITCYQSVALKHEEQEREVAKEVFEGKISEKLFYKIYEEFGISLVNFTNPEIDFTNRLKYEIKSIHHYDLVEFNFFIDCVIEGYEYWFQVELNIRKSLIKITCKILKNGLSLLAQQPGVIQSLTYFSLHFFPHFISSKDQSLKVNPIDGTVKYCSINFCSRNDFIQKLIHPAYLCEDLKLKVTYMQEMMNKHLLGRILTAYNQIPLSSIIPKNKQKFQSLNPLFDKNEVDRMTRVQEECRKTSEYTKISTYTIKHMNLNMLSDDPSFQIFNDEKQNDIQVRFGPQMSYFPENEKNIEKTFNNLILKRKNTSLMLPIFSMLCNNANRMNGFEAKNLSAELKKKPTDQNKNNESKNIQEKKNNPEIQQKQKENLIKIKEQIIRIRKQLRVNEYLNGFPNYISLYIWKFKDGPMAKKGFGGQLSLMKTEYSFQDEVDQYQLDMEKYQNGETVMAPQPPEKRQCMILRKYENHLNTTKRLPREKNVIQMFANASCPFVHRYFKCTFSPECQVSEVFEQDNLFMEFKYDKTLSQYVQMYSKILSLSTKLQFIYQILTGLRFLRDKGTNHLDIKPDNILVRVHCSPKEPQKAFFVLRLIDFGEAFTKTAIGSNSISRGITCPYASPEQCQGNPHRVINSSHNSHFDKSDVHGVGVIILTLFFDLNTSDIKYLSKTHWHSRPWTKYYSMCAEKCRYHGSQQHMQVLMEVAYKCLQDNSQNRPTLDWLTVIIRRLLLSFQGHHYQTNQVSDL